ncbi:DEAD-domain-containing protein [Epithele typhae]|uniref:DEAD-domain-containing protein n=1 Tax=Epithele typhae TaxID=378194 RepID=UPI002007ADB6|nr:DEAD-domain-containing protein [Epithele typhae]KAH9945937.1 DEAD-domain-containing protein [Epithele typhae]
MSVSTAFAGGWEKLPTPLTPWILDVISSMGHTQMTPVQASTIPLFMRHKDVVVEAVTGSGKTLAFVVPILEKLVRRERRLAKTEIGALVISPTRELATQIHSIFSLFLSSQPTSRQSLSPDEPSGSNVQLDSEPTYPPPLLVMSSDSAPVQDLQRFLSTGADIVIGTPGRIEELLLGKGSNIVSVKELEILVLDEADRLLDLGFQAVLTRILSHLPKQRRTGLFSATMTDADAMSELVRVGLRNPARIVVKVQSKKTKGMNASVQGEKEVVEERRIPANLQNFYMSCRASEKMLQLVRIIRHEVNQQQSSRFIVYFATCACVDYFYRVLSPLMPPGTDLFSLHGHLPPSARTKTLSNFTNSVALPTSPSILLATDVAARGLDLPDVDVVIQFDAPTDTKSFSHRCGRTARAGRKGRAWVLLVGREADYVEFMAVRKIPLKQKHRFSHDGSVVDQSDEDEDDPEVQSVVTIIRQKLLADRALHDKAAKAFVSFARAYSKHEASYIFRLKDLDLVGLAKSFGLLRLPRMPELKEVSTDGWADADLNWESYMYADKAQEAKRLAEAASKPTRSVEEIERRRAARVEKRKANTAWSSQSRRQEEREKRRDKKDRKKRWQKTQTSPGSESAEVKRGEGVPPSGSDEGDDWEDLAREERAAKRVKQGHLSQTEFDAEFADL